MMKPAEQLNEMMRWLLSTSHGLPRFDLGVGDASKGEGMYFRRDGLQGLSSFEVNTRLPFLRAANANGVDGARRKLNVYLSASSSQPQSWLLLDDIESVKRCREISVDREHMIIETSKCSYHLWIATSRPVSVAERAICQKVLQRKYGGDPGSTSGDHFGRIVGFSNAKRNCWVNFVSAVFPVVDQPRKRASVDRLLEMAVDFGLVSPPTGGVSSSQPQAVALPHAEGVGVSSGLRPQAATPNSASFVSSGRDESVAEFKFAIVHVQKGLNLSVGVQKLAARALARGKRSTFAAAEKYARATFERAQQCAARGAT